MKVYVNGKEKTLKEGATLKDAVAGEKYVEGSTVSIYLSTEKVTEVTNDFAIVTSQGEMVLHLYDTPEAKLFRKYASEAVGSHVRWANKELVAFGSFPTDIKYSAEAGMYRRVCTEFREVDAAGGLVSNRRGDYLLIQRSGLWDLPKGHQEAGEDIEVTALREVQEETGVDQLQLRRLICITDHCYFRDNLWHLKHTWWYDMLYTDPTNLTPQREEDITKAAWVAKSSLPPFLKNTYPSIVEVFREARI